MQGTNVLDRLKRVLFIAVIGVGVYGESADGMITVLPPAPIVPFALPGPGNSILDFNTIAIGVPVPSSMQPKLYFNPTIIGAPNTACVYFTVTFNGIPNNAINLFNNAAAVDPNPAQQNNIYFPMDGHQPTTPEAVAWSCANIDNTPNSPITEWYMKMFGVIPINPAPAPAAYVKAGWNNDNTAYRIIDTSALLTDDTNNELPKKYLHQRDAFEKNFRKIASTSVGRVLLYRILVEIRRYGVEATKNVGRVSPELPLPVAIVKRNDCRHLTIAWKPEGNSFVFTGKIINFGVQFPTRKLTTIGKNIAGYHEIILYSRSDEVGLAHEMIHWYHFLRNPDRYALERSADNGSSRINGTKKDGSLVIHIGNYYWPAVDDHWKISAIPWVVVGRKKDEFVVSFEEIRTILGSHSSISGYINGDDISENLYRSCNSHHLRFGHSGTAFYEDKSVIDKVISACNEKRPNYSSTEYSYEATPTNQNDKPRFDYLSNGLKKGIGNFKIPQFGVELIKP